MLMIDEKILENNDKMRRRINLILYNVVESGHSDVNVRIEHDKTMIKSFISEIDSSLIFPNECFRKVDRIGSFEKAKSDGDDIKSIRPIKLVMDSLQNKYLLLKKYRYARKNKKEFSNKMSMCPDFTPLERATYRQKKTADQRVTLRTSLDNSLEHEHGSVGSTTEEFEEDDNNSTTSSSFRG